jgi:hypothetical protein
MAIAGRHNTSPPSDKDTNKTEGQNPAKEKSLASLVDEHKCSQPASASQPAWQLISLSLPVCGADGRTRESSA